MGSIDTKRERLYAVVEKQLKVANLKFKEDGQGFVVWLKMPSTFREMINGIEMFGVFVMVREDALLIGVAPSAENGKLLEVPTEREREMIWLFHRLNSPDTEYRLNIMPESKLIICDTFVHAQALLTLEDPMNIVDTFCGLMSPLILTWKMIKELIDDKELTADEVLRGTCSAESTGTFMNIKTVAMMKSIMKSYLDPKREKIERNQ